MNRQQHLRGKSLLGLILSEQYRNWRFRRSGANSPHKHRMPMMRNREILMLEEVLNNL